MTPAFPRALFAWFTAICAAIVVWPEQPAAAPVFGVRNAHGIAYDSERRRTVLFGGADEDEVLADTRSWDPAKREWQLVTDAGPGPRTFPAMTYDDARRETVLFGGNRVLFGSDANPPAFLADTWVLRGAAWQLSKAAGPPARAEAAIAYDSRRRVVVLFGGYARNAGGAMTRLEDTWEWDGTSWIEQAVTGPAARNGAVMAYHARLQRVVLFGGRGATNDTWDWDGRHWCRRDTQEVPGRYNAMMVFDTVRRQLVRFGGWSGQSRTDDTWLFADDWRRVEGEGPSARNHAAMAFDHHRRRAVLVGGHDGDRVFGDAWEWDGRRWTRAGGEPPRLRVNNGH